MSSIIKKSQKGFSLVEVLIYAALLIGITFFIVQSTVTLLKSHSKISLDRSVEYSAESAMNKMIAEIKNASSINLAGSSLGTNPGTLFLSGTESGASYTILFSIQNGVVVFSKNGAPNVPVTSSDVSVSNLMFRATSTLNSSAVKVDLTVSATKSGFSKSLNLESFAVLRGSY